MKVFLTGGGGFLGFAIVKQLMQEGYEVVTYSRKKYEVIEKLGIHHYQGSVFHYETLRNAMYGCEAVIHSAAKIGMWGDYSSFYETNVTGTENILRACRELNIPYLLYTSSASVTYQGSSEGKNESLPYPEKFDAAYPKTKALAEQAVLKANCLNLVTCSLRPHLVWGPGDPYFIPQLFERRRRGTLRLIGNKQFLVDTTYVDNAARAHLQVLKMMQLSAPVVAGKAYFISQDEPIAIAAFINRILEAGQLLPVNKRVNSKVAMAAGWFFQNIFELLSIESQPPITVFLAKQLSSSHWYDISAAKRDFGYSPIITIDEGMKKLKIWIEAMAITGAL